MVYGRRGGYRQHFARFAPTSRFASYVRQVQSSKKSATAVLCTSVDEPCQYEVKAGDVDSGFLLPGTELSRAGDRDDNTVFIRGVKAQFEICVSRSCSVRMIAVVVPGSESNLFAVNEGRSCLTKKDGGGFGDASDSTVPIGRFIESSGLLSTTDSRTPFFRAVDKKMRKRVLLDQVQHFRVGGSLQFRQVQAWVDLNRKVTYYDGADGLCCHGIDETPSNVYFVVLFHVPSFTTEQASRLPAVTSMNIDSDEENESSSRRKGKVFKKVDRPGTAESEASTIILAPGTRAVLPALEVRLITSTLYWRERKE